MRRRFVKSEWAAEQCQRHGFSVQKAQKNLYLCCPQCGQPYAYQVGFLVEATKGELKGIGIQSSSALWAY